MEHLPPSQLIGVLMTGMGSDGAEAMALLRAKGGKTIAEAEETAVVWGMPGELVKAGGRISYCRCRTLRPAAEADADPCRSYVSPHRRMQSRRPTRPRCSLRLPMAPTTSAGPQRAQRPPCLAESTL
jgi:hypothetical protein